VFEREAVRTARAGEERVPESLRDVRRELPAVLERLDFAVENGESEPDLRLDYSGDPRVYVAIGGTVLARGLTLEGLVVSLFLRTSRQYDTLLQMGRWFGYRSGYEDLPRLWTTADLISKFRALASVEEEIREDIALYREFEGVTPMSFAVRVRSIPGMAITSASKMKHAHRASMSFEGQHIQTIRFDHLSLDVVRGNWRAASRLVDSAALESTIEKIGSNRLLRGVRFELVRRYIVETDISEQHMTLQSDHLLAYLDRKADDLARWNVAVIGSSGGEPSELPLGELGPVPTVRRARLGANSDSFADIKALMSKGDILVDASEKPDSLAGLNWAHLKELRPQEPLLLIYPIAANSQPRHSNSARVALGAVGDLIGFGMVFPGQRDRSGEYFAVDLDVPDPDLLDAEDDEVAEVDGPGRAPDDD
jgi:hypothetical protein